MGIITNALTIFLGSLFGGKLQKSANSKNCNILAIAIMLVSLVCV